MSLTVDRRLSLAGRSSNGDMMGAQLFLTWSHCCESLFRQPHFCLWTGYKCISYKDELTLKRSLIIVLKGMELLSVWGKKNVKKKKKTLEMLHLRCFTSQKLIWTGYPQSCSYIHCKPSLTCHKDSTCLDRSDRHLLIFSHTSSHTPTNVSHLFLCTAPKSWLQKLVDNRCPLCIGILLAIH